MNKDRDPQVIFPILSRVIPLERPERVSVLMGLINTEVDPGTQSLTTRNLTPAQLKEIKEIVFRLRNTQLGAQIIQERQRLITALIDLS